MEPSEKPKIEYYEWGSADLFVMAFDLGIFPSIAIEIKNNDFENQKRYPLKSHCLVTWDTKQTDYHK